MSDNILHKEKIKLHNGEFMEIGIIKTACYPCSYYAGFIFNNVQSDNATCYFHKSYEEALKALSKFKEN